MRDRKRKKGTLDDVFGILHRKGQKPVSVEEMDEAILAHPAEEAARQAGPRRPGRARPAVRTR